MCPGKREAYITRICSCGERRISHWTLLRGNSTEQVGLEGISGALQTHVAYLGHTSHRAGGELVDEGEGLLRLVRHDRRRRRG